MCIAFIRQTLVPLSHTVFLSQSDILYFDLHMHHLLMKTREGKVKKESIRFLPRPEIMALGCFL